MRKTIVMLLAIMLLPLTCLAGGKKQGKTFFRRQDMIVNHNFSIALTSCTVREFNTV